MIMQALNDPDRAVMREACLAAGESGNERFVKALAAIVRVEAHPQVVEAASEALVKLQAPWPATDAWIERLAHDEFAQEAVIFLSKRLDHPVAAGSMAGGRGSWHREDRLALRDSWQTFFAEPHRVDLVKANQPVPVTEAEAMNLLGAYSWQLDSRERWPSEKK